LGGILLNKLKNAILISSIVDNPAVATASGWKIDSKSGQASQHKPNKDTK
jgi:hypothetical protein